DGYDHADRTELPGYGALQADAADLDDDGYTDLVLVNYGSPHYSYIYWGSEDGFSEDDRDDIYTVNARKVHIEDFDQDGYLDLAFASYYGAQYVYWGGYGGFSTSNRTTLYANYAYDLAAEDLDGDGYTDLVYTAHYKYYDGDGYDTYAYVYYGSSVGFDDEDHDALDVKDARRVAVSDLDDDGYPDIVFANYYDGTDYQNVDSYIYWGSSAGYSEIFRDELPTYGALSLVITPDAPNF
ncbi:MAG: VCBS repeat-containing protein, partial [Myxococcota bacterium]|nr:VCBS repeat-containing protein [Myxococcota bacterium]